MTENFYYGNRLKAQIKDYYPRYNAFEVILYKTKKEVYKKLFFNGNKTRNQLYKEAHAMANQYLNTCNY